jgi:hypothetical protein
MDRQPPRVVVNKFHLGLVDEQQPILCGSYYYYYNYYPHVNSSLRSMTFNKKGFYFILFSSPPKKKLEMRSKDSINSGSLELFDVN